jgi:hypothetical protein
MHGNFSGAARQARIARPAGQIEVEFGRVGELPALAGYLGQQELVKQAGRQFDVRQTRNSYVLFGRPILGLQAGTGQQRYGDEQGKDRLHESGGRMKMLCVWSVYNDVMLAASNPAHA